jgi:hypothetical protein
MTHRENNCQLCAKVGHSTAAPKRMWMIWRGILEGLGSVERPLLLTLLACCKLPPKAENFHEIQPANSSRIGPRQLRGTPASSVIDDWNRHRKFDQILRKTCKRISLELFGQKTNVQFHIHRWKVELLLKCISESAGGTGNKNDLHSIWIRILWISDNRSRRSANLHVFFHPRSALAVRSVFVWSMAVYRLFVLPGVHIHRIGDYDWPVLLGKFLWFECKIWPV